MVGDLPFSSRGAYFCEKQGHYGISLNLLYLLYILSEAEEFEAQFPH